MIKGTRMRSAIAMIELIFAIVIIAISIMTIPSMMNVAVESTKRIALDDDVMSRLNGQLMDKFQARWGGEYEINTSRTPPAYISVIPSKSDLNCSRTNGISYWRKNPDSEAECLLDQNASVIPAVAGNNIGEANGSVAFGLEMLNSGTETLRISSSTGESFDINATYNVRYVSSDVVTNGNAQSATWTLGSSGTITADNGGVLGATLNDRTHLKRVVVRFWNNDLGVDTTLTFFKSNKGSN